MSTPNIEALRREYGVELLLESEVAAIVGRSQKSLKRWRQSGRITPSYYADQGQVRIWFYTEEDVKLAKQIASEIRPGRKKNAATNNA